MKPHFLDSGKDLLAEMMAEMERLTALGGPGSGNFGHAGRPGERGGSASGGGGAAKESAPKEPPAPPPPPPGPKIFATRAEADDWGIGTQGWLVEAEADEIGSLNSYCTFVGVNSALRGSEKMTDDPQRGRPVVKGLDKLMARPEAVLKEDVVAFRAWRNANAAALKPVGAEFTDYGFTSTSLVKGEIEVFKEQKYNEYGNPGRSTTLECEIRLPKGSRALFLGSAPPNHRGRWFQDNSELLLARGTTFRIVETNAQISQWGSYKATRVVLEVVKQKTPKGAK